MFPLTLVTSVCFQLQTTEDTEPNGLGKANENTCSVHRKATNIIMQFTHIKTVFSEMRKYQASAVFVPLLFLSIKLVLQSLCNCSLSFYFVAQTL